MAVDPSLVMFDPAFRLDPHPALRELRRGGEVLRSETTGVYFVLGHPEAIFVHRSTKLGRDLRLWKSPLCWSGDARRERDPVGFRMFSEFQPQMFNSNPPDHRRMRSVFQHAFTPVKVARMEELVREEAAELIEAMPASGEVDLMHALAGPLPVRVIARLFDVPREDANRLVQWSDEMIPVLELTITRPQKQIALDAMLQFKAYLRDFVATRKRTPGDGLVDHVIAAEAVEGELEEDELITNLLGMLVAGHETTTNLIGNGALSLMRNPESLARLRAEPKLLSTAIEELLRFEPPVNTNARVAIEDVVVGGVEIPAGSMLMAMLGAVNRDERVFADPDRLDVARDPNPHQTFGGGMHHCIGAPLARLEARVAFELLLARHGTIELVAEPQWLDRINVRGLASLPLRCRH